MARRPNLASLSLDALLKLRDDVAAALSEKAAALRTELAALGSGIGRAPTRGRKSLKGRKVPPKYRDPATSETWAGRGARPRWLVARLRAGRKLEDFAIDRAVKRHKKVRAKKHRKK
jgi:DNA-binding protein H-NS